MKNDDLVERLQKQAREWPKRGLLCDEAATRIKSLSAALRVAICQNEHDMLMTGEELRACRKALEPPLPSWQTPVVHDHGEEP